MEEQKPELSQEEMQKAHAEAHKELLERISRASKAISEVLEKEGLTLVVNHNIAIVPRQ